MKRDYSSVAANLEIFLCRFLTTTHSIHGMSEKKKHKKATIGLLYFLSTDKCTHVRDNGAFTNAEGLHRN